MRTDIKDVVIRQATAEDVRAFYPDGCPRTAYCWVADYKGEPACLAGLILERGGCVAFSEIKPDIDAPRLTVWRTAKQLFDKIVQLEMPMITACDRADFSAQRFVTRLGFTRGNRRLQGMEIFAWQQ